MGGVYAVANIRGGGDMAKLGIKRERNCKNKMYLTTLSRPLNT